jgi:hypothetical protein
MPMTMTIEMKIISVAIPGTAVAMIPSRRRPNRGTEDEEGTKRGTGHHRRELRLHDSLISERRAQSTRQPLKIRMRPRPRNTLPKRYCHSALKDIAAGRRP